MVKWKSYLASNEMVQVQLLVELLIENGRAARLATGAGWKPVEHFQTALRVQLPLLPLNFWQLVVSDNMVSVV